MTPTCARCGKPTRDGYVCREEAQRLAVDLQAAAGHAEDAKTVIARQTRYGGGSRGGHSEPLPVDLTASGRYAIAENVFTTWARHVAEQRSTELPARRPVIGPLCAAGAGCGHDSCDAIRHRRPPSSLVEATRWLATQIDWLRRRPEAAEAFDELHDASSLLARLVDRPADRELVGMCDCGRTLYARPGRTHVTCPQATCKLVWHVERSRDILRQSLDEKRVTAGEAARLAAYLDSDRTQPQIRALIAAWARRGQLVAVESGGEGQGWTYRFGDVAARLARTPRRTVM